MVIVEEGRPIAVIVGYGREDESMEAYSLNNLYLSELSVAKTHQKRGIGGKLLDAFIFYNNDLGFVVLPGKLNYTVQTNSAEFNKTVVYLYTLKGFESIGYKEYANRKGIVMRYWP